MQCTCVRLLISARKLRQAQATVPVHQRASKRMHMLIQTCMPCASRNTSDAMASITDVLESIQITTLGKDGLCCKQVMSMMGIWFVRLAERVLRT